MMLMNADVDVDDADSDGSGGGDAHSRGDGGDGKSDYNLRYFDNNLRYFYISCNTTITTVIVTVSMIAMVSRLLISFIATSFPS